MVKGNKTMNKKTYAYLNKSIIDTYNDSIGSGKLKYDTKFDKTSMTDKYNKNPTSINMPNSGNLLNTY